MDQQAESERAIQGPSDAVVAGPARPRWGPLFNSDIKIESPWARKVILSLDGGGVRGLISLYILEKLMQFVEEEERCLNPSQDTSLACSWSMCEPDSPNDRFFMRHYVDYFFGTSTGGLTAIMLGRLKLSITTAMKHYNDVGESVFARPRRFSRGMVSQIYYRLRDDYMDKALKKATAYPNLDIPENVSQMPQSGQQGWFDYRAGRVRMHEGRLYAGRTVAVASTTKEREPHLFRSYDHPAPPSHQSPNSQNAHISPGPASYAPVWKVARATSAAPGLFRPIEISQAWYEDGAMAKHNNPVHLAYNEVKQVSPFEPSMIISIGTGRKAPREERNLRGSQFMYGAKRVFAFLQDYRKELTNSHKAHETFESNLKDDEVQDGNKATYFRFDLPPDLFPYDVHLTDWKGRNGMTTKGHVREAIDGYLQDNDVKKELSLCAKKLVKIRRQRAETVRWEPFALDMHILYACPEIQQSPSCGGSVFDSREHLRQHAVDQHGYVSRARCKYTEKVKFDGTVSTSVRIIPWICLLDKCEQITAAFDEEVDFYTHLQHVHNISEPRVIDEEEFEQWLDSGRKPRTELNRQDTGLSRLTASRRTTMNGTRR